MKIIIGGTPPKTSGIAIVVSRFNEAITQRMLDACVDKLTKGGISSSSITLVWVPGAFEIPVTAARLIRKRSIGAVICLGAIIKGETDHYDHIARESARALMDLSLSSSKPVVYEILACKTMKQAQERSRANGYNKGEVAASVALEMISVLKQLNAANAK